MTHLVRSTVLGLLLAMPGVSLQAVAEAAQSQSTRDIAQEERNRQIVVDFYNRLFKHRDALQAAQVLDEGYVQHNPYVPDGKAPFVDYFTAYFKAHPQASARIVRSAADGDLVYLHVHATERPSDRGQAIVDIFRVKDGRIMEHWDVIQDVPEHGENTNTMF